MRCSVKETGESLRRVASSGAKKIDPALEAFKSTYETAATSFTKAAEYTDELYDRKFGEEGAQILDVCPVVTGILSHRKPFESDPEAFTILYNVRVRPLINAALVGSTGAGIVAYDEILSRITKDIFDGRQMVGGWASENIVSLIGEEKVKAINQYMDTVPGASHMGGGWIHRVQHGHDMSSVLQVYQDYGPDGALQALYHIYGRDFFTPAGVPILPVGSNEVHQYLTQELGMKPIEAADLLSINFMEILGSSLAGVFTVVGLFRLMDMIKAVRENAVVRDMVSRAQNAGENEDFVTSTALLQDAMSYRPDDGLLAFLHASMQLRAGRNLQAHFGFHRVTAHLSKDEPMLELGGARISLRGIAAFGALSTSDSLARADEHRMGWARPRHWIGTSGYHGL